MSIPAARFADGIAESSRKRNIFRWASVSLPRCSRISSTPVDDGSGATTLICESNCNLLLMNDGASDARVRRLAEFSYQLASRAWVGPMWYDTMLKAMVDLIRGRLRGRNGGVRRLAEAAAGDLSALRAASTLVRKQHTDAAGARASDLLIDAMAASHLGSTEGDS